MARLFGSVLPTNALKIALKVFRNGSVSISAKSNASAKHFTHILQYHYVSIANSKINHLLYSLWTTQEQKEYPLFKNNRWAN